MQARVAVVVGQFPALSETFVLNQVTGLLARGVDVQVLAGMRLPQAAMHPEYSGFRLAERTHYGESAPVGKWRRRGGVAGLWLRALLSNATSPRRLRHALRHGRHDAAAALRFARISPRRGRFDAILCHFGPQGEWGLALRTMGLLSGRLVTVFHGYDVSRHLREAGPDAYARLFREGDLFLPVTEHWRRRLIDCGCPPERTRVHRMGVALDEFAFVERGLPRDGRPLRILSVARLTEKKGLEYAIRAVARLAAELPHLQFDIVGDGPLRQELAALIEALGAAAHIRLLGPQPRPEVIRHMAAAHLLMAPSVTASDGNQEGLPVALMEALATGLPVVSTWHTGIPELIEHRVTGMLAPERNVDGLVGALRELAGDASLYGSIARAGRRRVEERHDNERLNDRLVELLTDRAARRMAGAAPAVAPRGRGAAARFAGAG
jgi:colanic acid/amylovoran biosynthesis glycosyltransferase